MSSEKLLDNLISQTLADREAERLEKARQRKYSYIKIGLVTGLVAAYMGMIGYGFLQGGSKKPSKPYVSVVKVTGEIMPDKSASAKALGPLLESAFKDSASKGVVLLINSPGGAPVQSSLIHDQIVELKKKYNKRVYAVGEDLMASGAYMIAVSADQIIVNRSTITGSVGVISRGFGFTGLMDKLGIERRVATAGSSKNMLDPFGPQTPQDTAKQHELLEEIHGHFKDTVKEGRGQRIDPTDETLFSGTVWTGDTAVKKGIADKLGSLQTAVSELGAEEVFEVAPKPSLMDTALGLITTKISEDLAFKAASPLLLPN